MMRMTRVVLGVVLIVGVMGCGGETEPAAPAPGVEAAPVEAPIAAKAVDTPQEEELVGKPAEGSEPKAGASGDVKTAEGAGALLSGLTPDGWTRLGEVEQYLVEDLYVKINGRSELYMSYGVKTLTFATIVNDEDKSQIFDAFIYDMAKPTNAFGIFSVERGQGHPEVALGREGYRDGKGLFFWKGQYYVCLVATDSAENVTEATDGVGAAVASALYDMGGEVEGLGVVPALDRVPGSIQYFMVDAMSLDFLTNTFTARYKKGEHTLTGFVSLQGSEADAGEAIVKYGEFVEKYGDSLERQEVAGVEFLIGDMGGVFDVVFQFEDKVAGISTSPDRSAALKASTDLLKELQGQ